MSLDILGKKVNDTEHAKTSVFTDQKGLVSYVQRLSVLGKCLKTLKITDISLFIIIYQGGNAHAVRSTL